jgi:peroxiredoxin
MFRITFLLTLAACAAAAQSNPQPRGAPPPGQAARPLGDIKVKTTDARGINLRRYRGKEVILFLFSTESDDCAKAVKYMSSIQDKLGPKGMQVVGIGVNNNAPYQLAGWNTRYRPTFPLGFMDPDMTVKLLAVKPDERPFVPIVVFIDPSSMVRYQFFGDSPIFKQPPEATEKVLSATAERLMDQYRKQHPPAPPAEKSPDK